MVIRLMRSKEVPAQTPPERLCASLLCIYNKMNIPAKVVAVLMASVAFSVAIEPPEIMSLRDDVRMSTLIVVGTVQKVAIVDARSSKLLRNKGSLKFNEKAWAEIKVERVLYSSKTEAPFYSPAKHPPEMVDVLYGSHEMDVGEDSNILPGRRYIFFLTNNFDDQRRYRYPFYDWTNLCVPVEKEDEVKRLIEAVDAIK